MHRICPNSVVPPLPLLLPLYLLVDGFVTRITFKYSCPVILLNSTPGSPPRGRYVAVYVFDINQLSLSTLVHSVLVSISVFVAFSIVFYSTNSPDNSPLFHCSSGLISAFLVLSTICLLMKVSFSPDIILCGWLGLKRQLTKYFDGCDWSHYFHQNVFRVYYWPSYTALCNGIQTFIELYSTDCLYLAVFIT